MFVRVPKICFCVSGVTRGRSGANLDLGEDRDSDMKIYKWEKKEE